MDFHALASLFPLISGAEFDDLVADIQTHGLREAIVVYEGKILDGRNRYRACEAAGIEPTYTVYQGEDPVGFVISLNLRRRHLTESQRAIVAAKLATLRDGQRADLVEGLPIGRASALLNVGERTVARAREVLDHGVPELKHAVEKGEVSVSAAANVATLPEGEQCEIVARGEGEILRAAQEIRARKAEVRHAQRIAKLTEISNAPIPSDRKYPVIYADPAWKYELYRPDTNRVAAQHYPCMTTADICALPVPATQDAVLFLWTTAPLLPEAFEVLKAWGFQYVSNIVWLKDKIGLGNWVRNQHELLLIARRGDMPCPLPNNRPPSIIQAPRREHSQKPDEAYEVIEKMYPDLPKIELFARSTRPGWSQWGNQLEAAE